MADTIGAKRRKQVGYSTGCPPWFKVEYSSRIDFSEHKSTQCALWTMRSSNQEQRVMRRRILMPQQSGS